jgi:hypothetical protein
MATAAIDEEGEFFATGDRPTAAPQGLFPLGELASLTGIESRDVLLWYSTGAKNEV